MLPRPQYLGSILLAVLALVHFDVGQYNLHAPDHDGASEKGFKKVNRSSRCRRATEWGRNSFAAHSQSLSFDRHDRTLGFALADL